MRVYYAHPISLYLSLQEERDITFLQKLGFEVINPNTSIHEEGYKKEGMSYFDHLILQCQLLVFRAFPDGSIPAGVAYEINFAKQYNISILELPVSINKRTLTVDQTRETLEEIGYR